MKKISILIVEDEKNISNFVSTILSNNSYKVMDCRTGREALTFLDHRMPNLVLLDLGLPDMDGLEVLKMIRQYSDIPVIIISARPLESDKVKALDLGADDYITKPFGTLELLARIRTALRHSTSKAPEHIFTIKDLAINFDDRSVMLRGEKVHVTKLEFELLSLLARNSGKVMTYDSLINSLWNDDDEKYNQVLRVNMASLRRKIEQNPGDPQYLFTEVGVGYRMADETMF